MRAFLLILSLIVFIILQINGGFTSWEQLSIALFVYFFLTFLLDLGKKVIILDFTILMGFITCLIMPIVFYHVYTKQNPLARLWVKYMPISSDEYFSFAVPAILALILGIRLPILKLKFNKNPAGYLDNVRAYLAENPKLGLYLVGVGLGAGMLDFLAPGGLKEVFFLMAHLIFVGVFYVIYSPNKYKRFIVPGVILLMLGESVATGMFGELVFIFACSLVLLLLGIRVSFAKKLTFALLGIAIIILLQSVKADYRKRSWFHGGADAGYFTELIADRLSSPSNIFDPAQMFVLSVRMNQGWLVAETMKMVPAKHPFGDGGPLAEAVAASVVPRFLWPDKPEAGGKANLKRFWGYNLVGWSTNIGTLGEAYANFDRTGGIAYMFFYGLFFNLGLSLILKKSEKRPTLILWLPFLFFSAIAVETDLLSTMGALVKSAIFAWIVFRAFDYFFHLKL